jgi:hypothetical protein
MKQVMYRQFVWNGGSIEAYNFLTRARNDMKLRRNIYEFIVNWVTLYKVLENVAAFRETHLNTTLQVVRGARQNVALNLQVCHPRCVVIKHDINSGSQINTTNI